MSKAYITLFEADGTAKGSRTYSDFYIKLRDNVSTTYIQGSNIDEFGAVLNKNIVAFNIVTPGHYEVFVYENGTYRSTQNILYLSANGVSDTYHIYAGQSIKTVYDLVKDACIADPTLRLRFIIHQGAKWCESDETYTHAVPNDTITYIADHDAVKIEDGWTGWDSQGKVAYFYNFDFSAIDFTNITTFKLLQFKNCNFQGSTFVGTETNNGKFQDTYFDHCNLVDTVWSGKVIGTQFLVCEFGNANLSAVTNISYTNWIGTRLCRGRKYNSVVFPAILPTIFADIFGFYKTTAVSYDRTTIWNDGYSVVRNFKIVGLVDLGNGNVTHDEYFLFDEYNYVYSISSSNLDIFIEAETESLFRLGFSTTSTIIKDIFTDISDYPQYELFFNIPTASIQSGKIIDVQRVGYADTSGSYNRFMRFRCIVQAISTKEIFDYDLINQNSPTDSVLIPFILKINRYR